jgi:hypothetical protein
LVWKPFTLSVNEPTLLLLDAFSSHQCAEVVRELNRLGTEVEHLPAGCTSAVQAIDNGINHPMKSSNGRRYQEFRMQALERGEEISAPTRKDVAFWISEAWETLSTEICRKSWKTRVPFYWFSCGESESSQ